jgi:hypothetical protein
VRDKERVERVEDIIILDSTAQASEELAVKSAVNFI